MQIEPTITVKPLKNTDVGELIVLRCQNQDALMILIAKDPRYVLVAVLDLPGTEDFGPSYMRLHPNGVCGSYGSDWTIQLLARPTLNNLNLKYNTGIVSVTADNEAILMLRPYDHGAGHEELAFDLRSNALTDLRGECCSVTSWAIWSSRASMSDPRQEPLYRFEHR